MQAYQQKLENEEKIFLKKIISKYFFSGFCAMAAFGGGELDYFALSGNDQVSIS